MRRQVLYLTLTSWLDKRTENADRERLAQAEKDRRAPRACCPRVCFVLTRWQQQLRCLSSLVASCSPALDLCNKQRVSCLLVSAAAQSSCLFQLFCFSQARKTCTLCSSQVSHVEPLLLLFAGSCQRSA
jgi:hypothetical protein